MPGFGPVPVNQQSGFLQPGSNESALLALLSTPFARDTLSSLLTGPVTVKGQHFPNSAPDAAFGFVDPIAAKPTIVLNGNLQGPEAEFLLAHEVAHLADVPKPIRAAWGDDEERVAEGIAQAFQFIRQRQQPSDAASKMTINWLSTLLSAK